jgi:hypothetical protein
VSDTTPTEPDGGLARVRVRFRGYPILDHTTNMCGATALARRHRQSLVGMLVTIDPADARPAHTDGPVH